MTGLQPDGALATYSMKPYVFQFLLNRVASLSTLQAGLYIILISFQLKPCGTTRLYPMTVICLQKEFSSSAMGRDGFSIREKLKPTEDNRRRKWRKREIREKERR